MKRLTIRNSDGSASQPTHSTFEKVFNRLADYEDIGLEPQEIMAAIQIKHGHVYQYPTVFGKDFEDVKKLIDAEEQGLLVRLPTAADVVEVVRCKDCDVPHNRWIGCCHLNGLIPPPDFYCAYGKRKIDKEE